MRHSLFRRCFRLCFNLLFQLGKRGIQDLYHGLQVLKGHDYVRSPLNRHDAVV